MNVPRLRRLVRARRAGALSAGEMTLGWCVVVAAWAAAVWFWP